MRYTSKCKTSLLIAGSEPSASWIISLTLNGSRNFSDQQNVPSLMHIKIITLLKPYASLRRVHFT